MWFCVYIFLFSWNQLFVYIFFSAYKVKSAVFDLVLTLCIGAYLGLVYLALWKSGSFVALVSQLTTSSTNNNSNSNSNGKTNGTVLNNNHSNGHVKVKKEY